VTALTALEGIVPSATLPMQQVLGISLVQLAVDVGLQPSKGATKRLIQGGGLRLNNIKVLSDEATVSMADIVDGRLLLLAAGKKKQVIDIGHLMRKYLRVRIPHHVIYSSFMLVLTKANYEEGLHCGGGHV